jgi:hypothetical protein
LTVFEPGFYQVTVTQNFGLPFNSVPTIIEAAPVSETTINTEHISCFGQEDGSIQVEISNSPVENIIWNNNLTGLEIDNLTSGIYSFIAFDSYGCQVIGTTEVIEPYPLGATYNITDVSCYSFADGSVEIIPNGGVEPYNIQLGGLNIDSLFAGSYSVEIEDNNGCLLTVPFDISEPEEISLIIETTPHLDDGTLGSAEIEISGGTAPYEVVWSNGVNNTNSIDNLPSGSYSLQIIDYNDCILNTDFEIAYITSISNLDNSKIQVFPNPASELIFINGLTENTNIQLKTISGQVVLKDILNPSQNVIEVGFISPGTYMLELDHRNLRYLQLIVIN